MINAGINPLEGKTHIENYMFFDSDQTEIILPETIQTIGIQAFSKADKLAHIYLPESIWEIQTYAFEYCSRKVEALTIHFAGTRADWDRIIKGHAWDRDCKLIVECKGD